MAPPNSALFPSKLQFRKVALLSLTITAPSSILETKELLSAFKVELTNSSAVPKSSFCWPSKMVLISVNFITDSALLPPHPKNLMLEMWM